MSGLDANRDTFVCHSDARGFTVRFAFEIKKPTNRWNRIKCHESEVDSLRRGAAASGRGNHTWSKREETQGDPQDCHEEFT